MKLSKNSWHAKWWLMNNHQLPESLCPYFWGLIWLAVKFPFAWIGYLIPDLRQYDGGDAKGSRAGITIIIYSILTLALGITEANNHTDDGLLWTILYMVMYTTLIVLATTAIVALIFGLIQLDEYIKDRKYKKRQERYEQGIYDDPKKEYVIVEWWKGFTGKYCPRVNWK